MQPTLEMIESQLRLGNVETASTLLSMLPPTASTDDRYWRFQQIIRRLESSHALSNSGEFDRASAELSVLQVLCPDWDLASRKLRELAYRKAKLHAELAKLHAAQSRGHWTEAAIAAQRAQSICPDLPVAQLLRASNSLAPQRRIADPRPAHQTQIWSPSSPTYRPSSRRIVRVSDESGALKAERFMIWIDGVGGYLACMAPVVTIGQAIPGSHVDIPLQADISRRHAVVRRLGEGYAIDPLHEVTINGKAISEAAYLVDGDEIGLGHKVRLRFVKKHSLSASARLDFVSRHRTQPSADGVLLMAESLIIGPGTGSHILCREWPHEIVLFRRGEGIGCRTSQPLTIDGQRFEGKSPLPFGAHLGGEGISLSLERLFGREV